MSDFDARFEALRRRFVERCSGDLAVLEKAQSEGVEAEVLRAAVHRLSGAAGTFGYPELSRLAGAVDDQLIVSGRAPEAMVQELTAAVRVLTRT